jgi:PAS domain S-box-containing protein
MGAMGAAGLAGWWLKIPFLVTLGASAPFQAPEALSLLVAGIVLLAFERGWRSAGWFALLPAGISCLVLLEAVLNRDLHLGDLFLLERLSNTGVQPGRSAPMTGICIGLGSLALIWRSARQSNPVRIPAEAVIGSVLASFGCSTLLGYLANLPAVTSWGGDVVVPPITAAGLVLFGLSLLALAWRENIRRKDETPAWAPIPAVIGCLTLTLILWIGLRERERAYFNARTGQSMDRMATAVNAAIEHEENAFERMARDLGYIARLDKESFNTSAVVQEEESMPDGCLSIAYVTRQDGAWRTEWIEDPKGGEWAIRFDHEKSDERRAAIREVERTSEPGVTATTRVNGSAMGFVIYAPVLRREPGDPAPKLVALVAGEFGYSAFFANFASESAQSYRLSVSIGDQTLYSGGPASSARNARYRVDRTYTIFDRRMQFAFAPSDDLVSREVGTLPEFALAAGICLSGLLGLSIHFARRARAGQQAAEHSNRRLQAENEERRRVEARLKESDERLRLALDSTEIGVFDWNVATGHVQYSNGLWAMLGYDSDRMPGVLDSWQALIHPDDLAAYRPAVESQLGGVRTFIDLEYRVRTRTGDWGWVYGRSKAIATDIRGRPTRIIGTVQDITDRVETEHQLRRAKAEADATSRAKSEFLASMSHEIRTPMNGIIGMTSLIAETPLSAEQRDYVNTIRSSSEALLTIINDILDFSKIESGKMEIERAPFGLALCLEETLDIFAVKAAEKNIELGYCMAPDVPAWITGDVTRLWQVVTNLVNNAVKFTASGSISIEVRRGAPAPGGRFFLEFAVRDTGIGIPADRLNRLFKAFSQVDSSTTRKYGGTGLGLAISQRLSQLMGGNIRVESTEGRGSAFIFTILTEAAQLPIDIDYHPPLPDPLQGGTVLLVDDNPVAQARLRLLFERWGATCVAVPDAKSAAAFVETLDHPPALLVVDHRAAAGGSPHDILPALACPRLVMVPFGHNAPAPPSGAHAFGTATKPLKDAAFMHAVTTLFSVVHEEEPSVIASETGVLAQEFPLRVLLAEDNPINQKVALGYLERLGYRADLVSNGSQAVAIFDTRDYDLVLMDLQMPEMDGFEASRQIRRRLTPQRQPKIVALTANAMEGDKELCLSAGMDDYISKPVKLHEITAAIRRQFVKAPAADGKVKAAG